jgi:hypothetical protein
MEELMYSSAILNLCTKWVVSFTPLSLYPRTHCTGGWVGHKAGKDITEKRKNPFTLHRIES